MKKITYLLSLLFAISLCAVEPTKKSMSEAELQKLQKQAELEKNKKLDKSELSEIKKTLLEVNKKLESDLSKTLGLIKANEKCINAIKVEADIEKCKNELYSNLTKN